MNEHQFNPDYAVPPGRTLQETLDSMGIERWQLAARSGLSVEMVERLITGGMPITKDIARRLSHVTHVPTSFWLAREAEYRKQLAILEERK